MRAPRPFPWGHQVASYGGVCQPIVIHWPKGIEEKGGLRTQWYHMIDIAPTVLEAVGVTEPEVVHGVKQKPIEGVSMLDTLNDAGRSHAAPSNISRWQATVASIRTAGFPPPYTVRRGRLRPVQRMPTIDGSFKRRRRL